jgi:hypothetical protein
MENIIQNSIVVNNFKNISKFSINIDKRNSKKLKEDETCCLEGHCLKIKKEIAENSTKIATKITWIKSYAKFVIETCN